jgi:hypothetical protein
MVLSHLGGWPYLELVEECGFELLDHLDGTGPQPRGQVVRILTDPQHLLQDHDVAGEDGE